MCGCAKPAAGLQLKKKKTIPLHVCSAHIATAIRSTHQCCATALHKKPYKCGLKPYYDCMVLDRKGNPLACKGIPPKAQWPLAEISGNTPAQVVEHIMTIAPFKKSIQPPFANTQLLSAISQLNCPICLSVLRLPYERLVCTRCLTE